MEENTEYYPTVVEIDGVYFDVLLTREDIKTGSQRAIDYPNLVPARAQCVYCEQKEQYCSTWQKIMGNCPKGVTYGN